MENIATMTGIACCLVIILTISTYGLSRIGWLRVSKRFPCFTRPIGACYNRISIWFNPLAQYKQSITVILSVDGVYFENHLLNKLPWSLWHPPFLIPWTGLADIQKTYFLGLSYVVLRFSIDDCLIAARLPSDALGEIEHYFPQVRMRFGLEK